ncbi:MAG: hypothetical protein ACI4JD_01045, partial [Ruminococcus sp.]
SALGENLSTDDMARLSMILEKQRNIRITDQVASDCINAICSEKSFSFDSDDDLLKLIEIKKKKR